MCNYAIPNSKHRVEGYTSPSIIWYHRFQFLTNFRKFAKSEKVRFIEKVGKLAKFIILLQDTHKEGSAALVSDQSWSWACTNQSMDLLALAFWSKFRPLEWNEWWHGNCGKREKLSFQAGAWSKVKQMLTQTDHGPMNKSLTQTIPQLMNTWYCRD